MRTLRLREVTCPKLPATKKSQDFELRQPDFRAQELTHYNSNIRDGIQLSSVLAQGYHLL